MSFPSIVALARERGLTLPDITEAEAKELLIASVRKDCPEGVAYLHARAHDAKNANQVVSWAENPNSILGRQLARLHTDAVRPVVEEFICHGMGLRFYNCCAGEVGKPDELAPASAKTQILLQSGDNIHGVSADC